MEKIIYSFHHPRHTVNTKRGRESLTDYIARYVREMENGTRLNIHKLRYGYSTVKNYRGFIIQFEEFFALFRKVVSSHDVISSALSLWAFAFIFIQYSPLI